MTTEELLHRGLPKWPQMLVTGPRLPEDLALEVIRRTDRWFVSGYGCNDHEGDRRLARRFRMPHYEDPAARYPDNFGKAYWERGERWKKAWGAIETQYVRNEWIGSSFLYGPHGWCHPDGRIGFIDNVGKWPSVEEIAADWQKVAEAFPLLTLTATLLDDDGDNCGARAIVTIAVTDGQVVLLEPRNPAPTPHREFTEADAVALFRHHPNHRERYPFREEVLWEWEKKAIAVDAEINACEPGVNR